MPEGSFADNVTQSLIRPVQRLVPGNPSDSKTIVPNPEAIFRIPGARPELYAFEPARGWRYPVLARA
jgi:hypothetical protein